MNLFFHVVGDFCELFWTLSIRALYIKYIRYDIILSIYSLQVYGHWSYHLHEFEPVIELFSSLYI